MTEHDVEHSHGMHVVHDGPRQAPPLLLIHGSGAAGASWGLMVPALAGHHHVIRVNLPGCGQSSPAPSYDVPAQANRVAAILDDLGLRHVAVAAHSSGGYVGTALAEQRPDLVGSLALISTGPSLDALLPQPVILRVLLGPPLGPLIWAIRSDALEVPVLVICGAADPRWDPASARQYDAVPNARVEMLPGVGHVPILEAPEPTSELLLAFTTTVAGGARVRRRAPG